MDVDNVPLDPSAPLAPTSDHKASDAANPRTLILTVGDTVKDFVISVLSRVGHDKYGVLHVRRGASSKEFREDLKKIKDILGLKDRKVYANAKELKYRHVLIMADRNRVDFPYSIWQIIKFLHNSWPSLLKVNKFMRVFIKPTFYALSKSKSTTQVLTFYSIPEYEEWEKNSRNKAPGYKTKDYSFKLLENIKSERSKCYFADLEQHIKDFVWLNDKEDGYAIAHAFEARTGGLEVPQAGATSFDSKAKCIRYVDFINKDFKQYLVANLQKSIPSILDGLKPSQRKILFCAFKKLIDEDAVVDHFSSYVADVGTSYHHHRNDLVNTIIGMAQDYVGSNNINLLQPLGDFGTRHMGGKDHAAGRYIGIKLSSITRYLFHKDDEQLIPNYLNDNGQSFEPEWFIPIIPMVLVNGSIGIGTGCSTFIPRYHPRDIIANLKRLLNDEDMVPMRPWYRGFTGVIKRTDATSYMTIGLIKEDYNDTLTVSEECNKTLTISELPVGRWTLRYEREVLKNALEKKRIEGYSNNSNDTTVHFDIEMNGDKLDIARQEGLCDHFKLTTKLSTDNMHVLDAIGEVKKYSTPELILEDFFQLRLPFYERRRIALLCELKKAELLLESKEMFINDVIMGNIVVINRKYDVVCDELKTRGFKSLLSIEKAAEKAAKKAADGVGIEETEEEEEGEEDPSYEYLLSMPFDIFFSPAKMRELKEERCLKRNEFLKLKDTDANSLWLKDLEDLECQLDAENYPVAEVKAPAKRKLDATIPQSANKRIRISGE